MISYLRFKILCFKFDFKYRKVFGIKAKDLFTYNIKEYKCNAQNL